MPAAEYQNTEFKESFAEWRQIIESLAAFASVRGGTVVVGMADNGTRVGVKLGKRTLEDFANNLKLNTKPSLFASIEVEGPEEDAIVRIQVGESPRKPV